MGLPFLPWLVMFASLFLYVMSAVGGTVVKDMYITSLTVQQGRAAAIYQDGIDPSNGRQVAQELADAISRVVPVEQVNVTQNGFPPSKENIGSKELRINVNYNDGSYVTTTMVYGAEMPLSPLLSRIGWHQNKPIPLNAQVSFYREW